MIETSLLIVMVLLVIIELISLYNNGIVVRRNYLMYEKDIGFKTLHIDRLEKALDASGRIDTYLLNEQGIRLLHPTMKKLMEQAEQDVPENHKLFDK